MEQNFEYDQTKMHNHYLLAKLKIENYCKL